MIKVGEQLSHVGESGEANMVDVSDKPETKRVAIASSIVRMSPRTLEAILDNEIQKGEVVAVARVAGIQAAKKCAELIPLCHPMPLDKVKITIEVLDEVSLKVVCECRVTHKTGVEMEAFSGAIVGALKIYDICTAIDQDMVIEMTGSLEKTGGKSGNWVRQGDL